MSHFPPTENFDDGDESKHPTESLLWVATIIAGALMGGAVGLAIAYFFGLSLLIGVLVGSIPGAIGGMFGSNSSKVQQQDPWQDHFEGENDVQM